MFEFFQITAFEDILKILSFFDIKTDEKLEIGDIEILFQEYDKLFFIVIEGFPIIGDSIYISNLKEEAYQILKEEIVNGFTDCGWGENIFDQRVWEFINKFGFKSDLETVYKTVDSHKSGISEDDVIELLSDRINVLLSYDYVSSLIIILESNGFIQFNDETKKLTVNKKLDFPF